MNDYYFHELEYVMFKIKNKLACKSCFIQFFAWLHIHPKTGAKKLYLKMVAQKLNLVILAFDHLEMSFVYSGGDLTDCGLLLLLLWIYSCLHTGLALSQKPLFVLFVTNKKGALDIRL